ncbi:MAG: putative collagen-binding domain-containing protein, partial [Bryobacteraceae bacterium]
TFAPYLDLDSVYPGDELGSGGTNQPTSPAQPYTMSLQAYNREGFRPHYLIEARYESLLGRPENAGPHASDRPRFRRQVFWSMLAGSTGHFFGNFPVWPFSKGWDGAEGIGSPGNRDMERIGVLFRSRPWHKLVPDQGHTAVTSGYCSFGQPDYVAAALAGDGSLIMAYVPDSGQRKRTLIVDMTRLSAKAEAKWFNPANGKYKSIGVRANSGSQRFEVPDDSGTGASDWVLVLEANPKEGR